MIFIDNISISIYERVSRRVQLISSCISICSANCLLSTVFCLRSTVYSCSTVVCRLSTAAFAAWPSMSAELFFEKRALNPHRNVMAQNVNIFIEVICFITAVRARRRSSIGPNHWTFLTRKHYREVI